MGYLPPAAIPSGQFGLERDAGANGLRGMSEGGVNVGVLVPDVVQQGPLLPTPVDDSARKRGMVEDTQAVLVVDDNAQLRDLLCTVLSPLTCDVIPLVPEKRRSPYCCSARSP